MEPKIKKTLRINEDAVRINKDAVTEEDFDKYSAGDTMLMIYHQHSGVWGEHLTTAMHVHNFYELEFVYGGKGVHILGNSSFPMAKGCAYLRTPNNLHTTWQDETDILRSYKFQFTGDLLPQEISAWLMTQNSGICVCFDDNEIEILFEKINVLRQEIREQKPYHAQFIRALFDEILILFVRKRHMFPGAPSLYSTHVSGALQYIHDHFREAIRVLDIAENLHLNAHYLGCLFREEVGKSILEYAEELKLQLAVQLLIHTNMTVNMISAESGFGSTSYFISRFKLRFGAAPLQYRAKMQK